MTIPERIKKLREFQLVCKQEDWEDVVCYINILVTELKRRERE
jgi:hypothetical protein